MKLMQLLNVLIICLTAGLLLMGLMSALNFMWFSTAVCFVCGVIGLAYIDTLEDFHHDL